jgi:hypothetical protein
MDGVQLPKRRRDDDGDGDDDNLRSENFKADEIEE